VKSIAKPSAIDLGRSFELTISQKVHSKGVPILVSASLLRRRRAGQVDLAVLSGDVILIYELKNSPWVSNAQKQRLKNSANFLSQILGKSAVIRYVFAKSILQSGST
jgi:hypothetical protein